MPTSGVKLCLECKKPMAGRVDKLRHPRCRKRIQMRKWRASVKARSAA